MTRAIAATFTIDPSGNFELEEQSAIAGDSLWEWIASALVGSKVTWVFGFGVAFQLSISGFWQRVEAGRWAIADLDPKSPDDRPHMEQGQFVEPSVVVNSAELQAELSARKPGGGFCVIEDIPTIVVARPVNGGGCVKLVDVRNYGVESIADIATSELRFEAIVEFMESFIQICKRENLGGLQTTSASQAFHGWRFGYMSHSVLCHDDAASLRLERESLYAGRNECFRLGNISGPIYHLDANSFYAAVARDAMLPTRFMGKGAIWISDLQSYLGRGFGVFADVTIETNEPIFPVRNKGIVIYPTGLFRTSLAGPELALALERDAIKKVHRASWHECEPIFTAWVDRLWAMRVDAKQRGEHWEEECVKRVMVALFGKFGQWNWSWVNDNSVVPYQPFGLWWAPRPEDATPEVSKGRLPVEPWDIDAMPQSRFCRWRSVGGCVQHESTRSEAFDSVPAVTAYLYSLARVRLLEMMTAAGRGNVHYVDTDSLFVNSYGVNNLAASNFVSTGELGRLKLKGTYEWMKLYGIKHYETPVAKVHAGIPSGSTWIEDWHCEFASAERMKSCLPDGRAPAATMIRRSYKLSAPYRHGVPLLNGTVRPHNLYEVQDERSDRPGSGL